MKYETYIIKIAAGKNDLKILEVVATSFESAWADVCEAYHNPILVQKGLK